MSNKAIVLSIRPQFAEKIFGGTKTVELRRVRPKQIKRGVLVLVYVSSPIKSLVGAFKVEQVFERPLAELWEMVSAQAGITREEFDQYYNGASSGVAIFFTEVWKLSKPIELHDLKEQEMGFQPPQSFRYATEKELTTPQLAQFIGELEIEYVIQQPLPDSETWE